MAEQEHPLKTQSIELANETAKLIKTVLAEKPLDGHALQRLACAYGIFVDKAAYYDL